MGFGGAPVVLNGPVILDLLVLRFSLLPAQGGSPPLPARGSKIKSGAHKGPSGKGKPTGV
eukprot:5868922-Prymnesium_polylepis.1